MKKALIIGGGFAGLTMAHQLRQTSKSWNITLIESGPEVGAGVRTKFLGGHPYTFGPRHFLTQNREVFDYLNTYCPLRLCSEHEFLTYVEPDAQFYSYPIHESDLPLMPEYEQIKKELGALVDSEGTPIRHTVSNFEEFWTASVGPTLYKKFINQYSLKMWQLASNTQLSSFNWSPKGTTIKCGPRAAWDTAISAYPISPYGYNNYFDLCADCIDHLYLNTRFNSDIKAVAKDYDLVVSTIAPDTLFGYSNGRLPFVGRIITTLVLPVEFALPPNVYFTYYAGSEPYTRVTEYKKFTQHKDPNSTLITLEQPVMHGRLYPLPTEKAQTFAQKYLAQLPSNVKSIGRAGSYDYRIDIDDCIAQAMAIVKEL